MASKSETGHAKNVATFEELISFAKGLGVKYNPSKEFIKVVSLENLHVTAKAALTTHKISKTDFNNATNKRAEVVEPMRKLSTRIVAASAVFVSEATLDDVKGIHRKIQGIRAPKATPKPKEGEEPPSDKIISASQQSYDSLIDHFEKMVETVSKQPDYKPNEPELAVAGLRAKLAEMQAANSEAINAGTILINARINRDVILYNNFSGLIAAVANVKNYIKSAFGYNSPQHKQVTGLKFTKP